MWQFRQGMGRYPVCPKHGGGYVSKNLWAVSAEVSMFICWRLVVYINGAIYHETRVDRGGPGWGEDRG